MQGRISVLGQNFYNRSSGHSLTVVRCALPNGGIYDGGMGQPYWLNDYGDDHSWGISFDVVYPSTGFDQLAFKNALADTLSYNGTTPCTYRMNIYQQAHVNCGQPHQ